MVTERFGAAVVRGRYVIVIAWIAGTVAMVLGLPSLSETQTGALGNLVPVNSKVIATEQRAAELFALPLSSRTVVVERDADGIAAERIALTARRVTQINSGTLQEVRDAQGAYAITNAVPQLPFARERATTNLSYLLFPTDVSQVRQTARSEDFVENLDVPADSYAGVTGAIPARVAQGRTTNDALPLFEFVTLIVVGLAVAIYLRSLVAPVVTLLTVALSYIVALRMLGVAGSALGISVPTEIEPIVVALLFGVVTDYGLFYMSRFRRRLREGDSPREASRRTIVELTPIILACGMAVAAGMAALGIAELGFLRAFGPGMAIAMLTGLAVAMTFLPACLALVGPRLFWPTDPRRAAIAARRLQSSRRTERIVRTAVRAPRRTIAATLVVLAAMGSGLAWLEIGEPLLRGLPADSEPRVAFEQLSEGFAPGAVAPTTFLVEGEGVADRRRKLRALQSLLADQPGIAGVIGPADSPVDRPLGAVLSPSGDAARFVLVTQDDPLGANAIRLVSNLEARAEGLLDAVGLKGARARFGGDTALFAELIATANDDLLRVGPVVLLAVALVLVIFLRALVAPLYLVGLAALGPLAALGLSVGFFQGLLGMAEISYFVPIVAGVLLVSLGSDYNIFLVGRIWDEARESPLPEAIVSGATGAARAISAAGLILAASFGALALVPVRSFQQLAFVLAAGLLIDAFIVRTVLAPAVIRLVGERSGWPGRRLSRHPSGSSVVAPVRT